MPMARRKNPIHKLRKALALMVPRKLIAQKLLLLKRNNKYKLFRHYNYAYVGEYQFTPSSTPLISHHHHHHHSGFSKKRRSRILYLLCGGACMGSMIETNLDFGELNEPSPLLVWNKEHEENRAIEELEWNGGDNVGGNAEREDHEGEWEREEDDNSSVDGRAQRFIEKFYEEIRLERQQSFLQWKEMLQRSC